MPAMSDDLGHDLVTGQLVAGQYEIDAPVGEGGMGEVYLAYDRSLGTRRRVALKILSRRFVGRPAREERFKNEARFGGRLPIHANLATTLHAGRSEDGRPFIVMEYVDGPAINGLSVVTGRTILPVEKCRLARGVADALRVVHGAGLVHRDLTPTNVLVTTIGGEWVPKLIDFSHSAAIDGSRLQLGHPSRLTQPHETPGTPGYMPPEQVRNAYPSPSMDVFAFGVMLWELLAERHAFWQRDRVDYLETQRNEPQGPPPLEERVPGLPRAIYELVADCTRLDPSERPSAQDIIRRLDEVEWGTTRGRRAAGTRSAPEREPTPAASAPVVPLVTSPPATEHAGEVERDEGPGRTLIGVALAVIALVVVAAIGWVWLQRDDQPGEVPRAGESATDVTNTARAQQPANAAGSDDSAPIPAVTPEPAPAAAPEPEVVPKPAPDEPVDDEPAVDEPEPRASDRQPQPRPKTRQRGRSATSVRDSAECVALRQSAAAAKDRLDWSEILRLTDQSRCWTTTARARLRARAMSELGRFEACVREHGRSRDPVVMDAVKACKEGL